ncbi:MAG: topoisomerase DNA-binding C4 zinc finger domain-containing protein [Patescibacteria group bacterium]|nr:topoisomerase DNA-binding C4 zinc finger domain-containing protein [Patescibacteria group bacterium]
MAADPELVKGTSAFVWIIVKYFVPPILIIGIIIFILKLLRIKAERKITRWWLKRQKFEKCPDCDGSLVKKNGKYGPFLGCSNYPKCGYTRKIENKV